MSNPEDSDNIPLLCPECGNRDLGPRVLPMPADGLCRPLLAISPPCSILGCPGRMLNERVFSAIQLVTLERKRQVVREGWDAKHDDEHGEGELAQAAACYALDEAQVHIPKQLNSSRGADPNCYKYDYSRSEAGQIDWPWDPEWFKPSEDPVRNLVKAGALIVAEIERLRRKEANAQPS